MSTYRAARLGAGGPALHWDCGDTQNTSLSTTELIVSRMEGDRMHLKEELTKLPEENEQARAWLRAWHILATEQKSWEWNSAGSGLRAGMWGKSICGEKVPWVRMEKTNSHVWVKVERRNEASINFTLQKKKTYKLLFLFFLKKKVCS